MENQNQDPSGKSVRLVILGIFIGIAIVYVVGYGRTYFYDQQKTEQNAIEIKMKEADSLKEEKSKEFEARLQQYTFIATDVNPIIYKDIKRLGHKMMTSGKYPIKTENNGNDFNVVEFKTLDGISGQIQNSSVGEEDFCVLFYNENGTDIFSSLWEEGLFSVCSKSIGITETVCVNNPSLKPKISSARKRFHAYILYLIDNV